MGALVDFNGVRAYVLFDSGSTSDSVSPSFTMVANMTVIELQNPAVLQLGCRGSRSMINFGAEGVMTFAGVKDTTYLDVVNLDRYDIVLGTPFLHKYGVSLDFGTRTIRVRGVAVPSFTVGEDEVIRKNRELTSGAKSSTTKLRPCLRD